MDHYQNEDAGDPHAMGAADASAMRCNSCGCWLDDENDLCPDCEAAEEPEDQFMSDAEADADVLASAGWGTDEDYGYFGGDE